MKGSGSAAIYFDQIYYELLPSLTQHLTLHEQAFLLVLFPVSSRIMKTKYFVIVRYVFYAMVACYFNWKNTML